MIVICKHKTEKELSKKLIGIGYTKSTVFHIEYGKRYNVLAISLWCNVIHVLLSDENNLPNWFPMELFSIVDHHLPMDWIFSNISDNDYGLQAIWGYEQLIANDAHYDELLERNPNALRDFHAENNKNSK